MPDIIGLEVPNEDWSFNTLRAYMLRVITKTEAQASAEVLTLRVLVETRHELYQERFKDAQIAVTAALASQQKETAAAFECSEKAIDKAELAAEKRFESVNAFRQTLSEQTSTFMPRTEVDQEIRSLAAQIGALTSRIERSEGKGSGLQAGWGYLVAALTLLLLAATGAIGLLAFFHH
jgi:hypothetical protein